MLLTFPIFKFKLNPVCNILFPVPELEASQDWFKSNSDFLVLDGGWFWCVSVCVHMQIVCMVFCFYSGLKVCCDLLRSGSEKIF